MPRRDQLEIISRSGAVAFHELDPARGITNIGRNPENDVIIDGPEVAPFHAVLDHRHKPYQVMTLTPEAKAVIGDQALLPNVAHELHNWDTIEIDGHVIVLIEDEAGEPASRPAAAPPLSTPAPTPGTEMSYWNMGKGPVTGPAPAPVTALTPLPQATTPLPMLPVDQPDEVIITDLSERQWIIDCEQTATCQLTIINGGDIVASFNVQVEGLDPSWVVIAPPQVNLNEGERATVAIALTPPRASTSRAGPHHFAISVSSPNYPGRISRRGATLTVNPYYDFTLGELSPRQQTVTWRKRTGRATLPIANKGNGDAAFRLDAEDDQRGCAFEFHLPNETGGQARQAELHLAPEEESVVSVLMTPTKRRVIGLRKHMYSLTFTTTLLQGTLTPRSVLGQLQSAALIGMGLLLLILATLAFLVVLIFQPYITNFTGPNNCTSDCVVRGGNSLLLSWRASPFVNLKIDHEVGAVDGPEGSRSKRHPKPSTARPSCRTGAMRMRTGRRGPLRPGSCGGGGKGGVRGGSSCGGGGGRPPAWRFPRASRRAARQPSSGV